MSTKVASIYAELGIDSKKFDTGIKSVFSGLGDIIRGFGGAVLGSAAFIKTLQSIGSSLKSTIDNTVEYADEVRNLSRIIGATPEEASKLIQAADDVFISVDQLTTGLKQAIRLGFEPTIEGLGGLSNKYLSIQAPIARTKFLMDTFGKAGADLGPLMELGAEGIYRLGKDAENTGLVLDQSAIDATLEYKEAIDELNDVLEGYKTKGGLILAQMVIDLDKFIKLQGDAMDLYEAKDPIDSATQSYIALGNALLFAKDTSEGLTQAQLDLKAAQDAVKGVMGFATQALRDYNISAQEKLWLDDQIALATGKMTEQDIALRDAVNDLTSQLEDGTITQYEYFAALQAMNAEALTGVSVLSVLSDALNNLPREIRTKILIEQHGYKTGAWNSTTGDGVPQMEATGGPAYAGNPYIVGESGPEPFIPEVDGRILSRSDAMLALSEGKGGGGDTYNYNLTMPTTADPVDVGMAFEILKAYGGR